MLHMFPWRSNGIVNKFMPHRADKPQFISHRAGKPLLFWVLSGPVWVTEGAAVSKTNAVPWWATSCTTNITLRSAFNKPPEEPPKLCANKVLWSRPGILVPQYNGNSTSSQAGSKPNSRSHKHTLQLVIGENSRARLVVFYWYCIRPLT